MRLGSSRAFPPERATTSTERMSSRTSVIGMPLKGGFNFSQADFTAWAAETGFREVRFEPLAGPTSAAIAVK
jgi:hypothetical protein